MLRNAGIEFEVRPAEVDESLHEGEDPFEYVKRLAREKALAVLKTAPRNAMVVGADTTVVVGGVSLGKPVDAEDARRMLRLLSGRRHEVTTGICVAYRRGDEVVESEVASEITQVKFAAMTAEEIDAYVASGEPMDKAGAYAIQGRASRWIPEIRGCYFNVVGLPVARLCGMLLRVEEELGLEEKQAEEKLHGQLLRAKQ